MLLQQMALHTAGAMPGDDDIKRTDSDQLVAVAAVNQCCTGTGCCSKSQQCNLQRCFQHVLVHCALRLLLQAMDAYASRITANVTWNSDIGRGFLQLFFTKVLQYHIITGRCGNGCNCRRRVVQLLMQI
jgi:hypothetical protein